MIDKRRMADNYDISVNSTSDFDAVGLYIRDESDSANNLEVKYDDFTVNDSFSILDDYGVYIEEKKRENERKSRNLIRKLIDFVFRR